MIKLALTSPHMQNSDVVTAQLELRRHGWLQGTIDGEFGPDTMRATKRAQYYMGYTLHNINGVYNQYLDNLLTGSNTLRPDQLARRNARLVVPTKPKRVKMLERSYTFIGVKEDPPNSNDVLWSRKWKAVGQPWCAMFASCMAIDVGYKQCTLGRNWAYCPYIVDNARAGTNGLILTYTPKPGNWVLYDWDNDGKADHIGIFDRWLNMGLGTFVAVEGNTSLSNNSNGGEVMKRDDRHKSNVIAFVHLAEGLGA